MARKKIGVILPKALKMVRNFRQKVEKKKSPIDAKIAQILKKSAQIYT